MFSNDHYSGQLISRKELSAIMGVSKGTLKRAESRGELHPLKFNARLLRYDINDIARWFVESSCPGKPGAPCRLEVFIDRFKARLSARSRKEATAINN